MRGIAGGLEAGFLNLNMIDILGKIILCWWGELSCTLQDVEQYPSTDLYSLDACKAFTLSWLWQPKICPDIARCLLGNQIAPGWELLG